MGLCQARAVTICAFFDVFGTCVSQRQLVAVEL